MSKQKKMKPLLLATAADAVRALVIDVNGRASAHTATPRDIVGMTEELEKLREKTLLPKASAVGMRVVVTTEGPSASSYKYAVNGSQAGFVFTKKGWALDRYEKVGVYPKTKRRVQVHVTKVQAEEIRRRSTEWLVIDKAQPTSAPVVKLDDLVVEHQALWQHSGIPDAA